MSATRLLLWNWCWCDYVAWISWVDGYSSAIRAWQLPQIHCGNHSHAQVPHCPIDAIFAPYGVLGDQVSIAQGKGNVQECAHRRWCATLVLRSPVCHCTISPTNRGPYPFIARGVPGLDFSTDIHDGNLAMLAVDLCRFNGRVQALDAIRLRLSHLVDVASIITKVIYGVEVLQWAFSVGVTGGRRAWCLYGRPTLVVPESASLSWIAISRLEACLSG